MQSIPTRTSSAVGASQAGLGVASSGWPAALLLVVLGLAGLGTFFFQEAASALRTWNNSAAYNHCWLVLPIAGWLARTRRHRLERLQPRPAPWLALLAVPVGAAWLAAERLGIMEGRQFTALAMVYVLLLCVLGWRVCRAMAAPLIYLVFLVPFGAFSVPLLQRITAWMIELGLRALAIPNYVDDLIIETTAGTFLVAEACAGLRFLIASLAFGTLYALVMFRSPGRRAIVLALSLVVPVVANGFRAFGIVLLGEFLGSAEAAAADHVIYGWGFFSAIMLVLIVIGLPFRQDGQPEPQPGLPADADLPAAPLSAAAAMLLAVGLASAGPTVSMSLQAEAARAPERLEISLAALEGCEPGPGGRLLHCGDVAISAQLIAFPAQATWSLVSAERSRIGGSDDQDILFSVAAPVSAGWRARQSREAGTTIALSAWLNGRPAGGGIRSRIEQAWNSVGGGRGAPILVAVTLRPEDGMAATLNAPRQRALLEALLRNQGAAIGEGAASRSGQ